MSHRSTFPGTIDGACGAAQWLRDLAEREHLGKDLTFALEVCLEELFINVVRHGRPPRPLDDHAAEPAEPLSVDVGVQIAGGAVDLTIEDNGRTFNVSLAPAKPIRQPLDEVVPGGLGMQLIRSFSNTMRYEPLPMGNRVVVNFLRSEPTRSSADA